jgi:hypothetical protein
MLFLGILFIVAALTSFYFASLMKSEKLIHPERHDGHPYRENNLKEFIKRNPNKKVLTYVGIFFVVVGMGLIYTGLEIKGSIVININSEHSDLLKKSTKQTTIERDICLGKLSVWEQAYGKPQP